MIDDEVKNLFFLYRRTEILPDDSIGAIFIGESDANRQFDLRISLTQAKTLRNMLNVALGE